MVKTSPVLAAAAALLSLVGTISVPADTLSLDEYVKLALRHNPKQRKAAGAVEESDAARASAFSDLLPHIEASAGVARSATGGLAGGPSYRPPGNSGSAGIDGKALLFDFGKTPLRYKASGKAAEAAKYDLYSTLQSTVLDARTAYFNVLLAARLLSVNEDALKQAQAHHDQAKTLFEVGKSAQIAVTKASVDVANARVGVIRADNARKLARVRLETAAGISFRDPLVLTDSLSAVEDSIGLGDALARSRERRPELRAAHARVEAVRIQLKAARASYMPSIFATAGYDWRTSGTSDLTLPEWSKPGWNFGAGLSVPLYQGGAVHAGVRKADAVLRQAEAAFDQTFLSIGQETQQYHFEEAEARQRIAATATLIEEASEGLRMSQERYKTGVAASIEITDAEMTLANARISHLEAQFDYRVAHAKLLAAIGALYEEN